MSIGKQVASTMILAAALAVLAAAGCSERDAADLAPARGDTDPVVFGDAMGDGVYYQGFSGTHYDAVTTDSVYAWDGSAYDGARSLKVTVPPLGSALGAYAGGVLTSAGARDLADYNALTFYARTDAEGGILLNEVGFGNDNTGASRYGVSRGNLALTDEWAFHIVPVPAPGKLISERGLFLYAEGAEEGHPDGYHLWFDEIRFATLGNIEVYRPSLTSVSRQYFLGSTVAIDGTRTIFRIDGAFVPVNHSPDWFDYTTSEPAVARVANGAVRVVGEGTATVSATLGDVDVAGRITVTGYAPPAVPAPAPTLPAGDVISMFSDAYADVPVGTWNTQWGGSTARLESYAVAGDPVLMYSGLNFVGVEFLEPVIDATAMTHLHLDVYAPEGTNFRVKLVSFPPAVTGSVETTDLTLDAASTPAFTAGQWSSLDIPLSDFTLPADWDWSTIGQMVFSTADAQLVLVDNVYWHR